MPDNLNLNEPLEAVKKQALDLTGMWDKWGQEENKFVSDFTNYLSSRPGVSQQAEKIGGELGLPSLRENAFRLAEQVRGIPETYTQAVRGFSVNQNQLNRIINQKLTELSPIAQRAQEQLNFGEAELGRRLGYAQADEEKMLMPWKYRYDFTTSRLARESTGYNFSQQRELDALIAKMKTGADLEIAEKNRLQELAIKEKEFENALERAKLSTPKADNPYLSIGEGSTIFNTSTGKPIYVAPKSYAPSQYNPGRGW